MNILLAVLLVAPPSAADRIVASAEAQAKRATKFDQGYFKIKYPNGDVPADRGACVDVVIRSFRAAGYDLQRLVHEDLQAHWSAYPRYKGLSSTDTNIDHRRVKNLRVYFQRAGCQLPAKDWKPGDVVTWDLGGGMDHTGVVVSSDGPTIVHNLGGMQRAKCLENWSVTGHYRFPKAR